ncbi:hypothetical protein M6G63_28225 (plasmid) [Pseudomonas sp. BYT-5]|uniref:hypothetical protein n=1 Tax=Pseudomonas sp. BYT-5 TaxID=2944392 RepID=UPI0020229951|nr:hypothetical protein [Pseudomonas sp. BYT-5]URD45709.1 hypothetical protein M6G63_28225 [Pseudomonas sp. BYT-5]
MTITDPAHVAAAQGAAVKQFQRPHATPAPDDDMERDLADYTTARSGSSTAA